MVCSLSSRILPLLVLVDTSLWEERTDSIVVRSQTAIFFLSAQRSTALLTCTVMSSETWPRLVSWAPGPQHTAIAGHLDRIGFPQWK